MTASLPNPSMKVLMTADAVGGVWTYALDLARALRPHGVATSLATMGPPPDASQKRAAAEVPDLQLHESTYKLEWMDEPWDSVRKAGEWLLWLESQVRPDVVHLNGYVHASLPWRAPVMSVAHSCVLSWWEAVKGEPAPRSWSQYRTHVAQGLHAASLVAAPTGAMLNATSRHYGISGGVVVPNARDSQRFRRQPKEPYVLAAGRLWDEAKNVMTLAKTASCVPWPVVVAGDFRHPERGDGEIPPGIRLLGKLSPSHLSQWLSRAAIYALPARYEPFGLSILEAGLSGCALVLGDIPSLREVWGDAALYVPPNDHEALATALRVLIEAPDKREEFSERALDRARHYNFDRMASGYLGAYDALLNGKAASFRGHSPSRELH
jgi:glycogen synthase